MEGNDAWHDDEVTSHLRRVTSGNFQTQLPTEHAENTEKAKWVRKPYCVFRVFRGQPQVSCRKTSSGG